MPIETELPGHALVAAGLADLRAGRRSAAALLVAMASKRLSAVGIDVPAAGVDRPAHALYELLEAGDPAAAREPTRI